MARHGGGAPRLGLQSLFQEGTFAGLTDGQLLERFATRGGDGAELAFAALVQRHGPMVLRACRGILRDDHEAMDAFQATFLVLVCKAQSLWVRDSVGPWLHRVACRAAGRARAQASRRRALERRLAEMPPGRAGGDDPEGLAAIVHEELDRLPDRYRMPIILCDLEGRTCEEAARGLGCPVGTIGSRLARGRERLRDRLTRRGLAPASAILGVASAIGVEARAAMPSALADSTACVASRYAAGASSAGVTPSVAAIIEGIVMQMSMARLSIMAAAIVMAATLASGSVWLSGSAARATGGPAAVARAAGAGARAEVAAGGIAWGEAVDGLQLGLQVAEDGRPARLGESVEFIIWVRNVRGQPATLSYRAGWFDTSPPVVVDRDGKPARVAMPPKKLLVDVPIFDEHGKKVDAPPQSAIDWRPVLELSVGPGQSIEWNTVAVALAPSSEEGPADRPTARVTPGVWKVRFGELSTSHPRLETGPAEIMVERAAAPGDRHKAGPLGGAARRLVGSWQLNGGPASTYHADGTGTNPDGSRFEWRLEGDILAARRLSPDGRPGDWSRMVILFSQDGQEYRLLLDKEYSFSRVLPGGKQAEPRTEEGRRFPRRPVPKEDEGGAPAPSSRVDPGPGRGAARTAPADGQIVVGPNVHVSKANAGILHAEVVLAADPVDPRRLVAASMYAPPPVDPTAPKIVVYASSDGGKSWTPTLERKDANPATLADPAFAWGAGDSLYFVNMWASSLDKLTGDASCLQVVRSRDGGLTWGPTTTVRGPHDRPFLALDRTADDSRGRLYCLVHDGLLVSTDSGQSFGPPRTWARRPGYVPYGSGNPLVLSDGMLVVLYNNSARREPGAKPQPNPGEERRYLAVRTSRDGGDSFSEEVVLAEYRGAGYPMMAAGPPRSPWQDHLYVVWQEELPGGQRCVAYADSKDRGATFSRPVVLSEPSPEPGDHEAFVPSVAVNKAGVVAVTWYDTRGLRRDEAGWSVRVRASTDGGETWTPSVPVSDVPTLKDRKRRKPLPGVGHTAGLAAAADGLFHCLWVDGRGGVLQAYTAAVRVGSRREP